MYLTGNQNAKVKPLLDAGVLGLLNTPKNAYPIAEGWTWAADNGCYNAATYGGDAAWFAWLQKFTPEQRATCLFATAPDVVGDHYATRLRSAMWLRRIRGLGYPAAFVAQDGMTVENTPWHWFDVLFIGGSTEWKLGPEAKVVIAHAKSIGLPVHVGRVNSQKRFLAFAALGVSSVDGTFIGFGPDENLPKLLGWIRHHDTQRPLFEVTT